MSLVADQPMEVTDDDRVELQSHFPYAGVKLSELSVQEERLVLFHLRGVYDILIDYSSSFGVHSLAKDVTDVPPCRLA